MSRDGSGVRRLLWRGQRLVVDRARSLLTRSVLARTWAIPDPRGIVSSHPTRSSPADSSAIHRLETLLDRHRLIQPDRTSCGSSVLVALQMLYDGDVFDAVAGAGDPVAEFGRRALAMRRRTNALLGVRHHLQLPWPAALGTRPAALIWMLRSGTGRRFRNAVIDPFDPGQAFDRIADLAAAGQPVPLYIGDGHWMQHIVLVLDSLAPESDPSTREVVVYDPACGRRLVRSRQAFVTDALDVAGWDRPWLAILPR